MLRATCLILLASFAVGLQFQAKLNMQWDRFKSAHGKKYSREEEKNRQEVFKKNVEDILQHNLRADLGEVSYTKGINEYSDMTPEEFTRRMTLGLNISQLQSNLKFFKAPLMAPSANLRAPLTMDLRQSGVVTGIKNQGACGSCWAFATIGTVEGAWAKAKGKLVSLSEQHLVDCFGKNCEDGQYPGNAMNYIIKNQGISADSCYPYTGKGPFQCRTNTACKAATIKQYLQVPKGNEEALKQAVANGPVAATHHFNTNMYNYKSGVFYEKNCGSDRETHAMVIVGYGTEGGRDYWLMKNSWGESWGEKGYFKLARNSGNTCGISDWALYVVV